MKIKRPPKRFAIPLNAMSDVAFLLLIFIMLVSLINYRKEVKIDYAEGESAKKVSAGKNLEIWVDRQGAVYLDGGPCGLGDVEAAVGELYMSAPDTRIHLIADRDTPFVFVDRVLKILQARQYRTVSFVVKDG
ncbi:MAG: biopolymer transporter ExbD [Spirochaetaceae bacterium]|jgi:biopolymer transport protein ExbD|nr:biopolymer transporter ExbD [Spirochaetaceae bacterium]